MSNKESLMKKGQEWTDENGTNIKAVIESDKQNDGSYIVSVSKPGFIPMILRQPSIPSEEKQQDKVVDKWNELLEKEADKTDKKNEDVKSIVVGEHTGRIFRISETKKKKLDVKSSPRKTKKRKVIGSRGTVFTVYGSKSRKKRRKRTRKSRKRKRKKKTKKRRK
jgi:hypothetical protein